MRRLLTFIVVLAAGAGAWAQPLDPLGGLSGFDLPQTLGLTADAVVSHTQVRPGDTFFAAVRLTPPEGWAYYSPAPGVSHGFEPGRAGLVTDVGKLQVGELRWSPDTPHEYDLGEGAKYVNNAYEREAVVYVPLTAPKDASPGTYRLTFRPKGQMCGEQQCLEVDRPDEIVVVAEVIVGDSSVENPEWHEVSAGLGEALTVVELRQRHADEGGAGGLGGVRAIEAPQLPLVSGLGLALLAGLILNIMPCVLPVIPIRILSIVSLAKESRRRFVTLGLAFAGGILLFFVGLAAINTGLRLVRGETLDWSKHFQEAGFQVGMAMLMVALAANLFGVFDVVLPPKVAGLGQDAGGHGRDHLASVGMGLMMAILATPCSFAILVMALAWAQIQPVWLGALTIALIGVGPARRADGVSASGGQAA